MLRVYIDSDPDKNNQSVWKYCPEENKNLAKEVVSFHNLDSKDQLFESEWKSRFEGALNSPSFPDQGPLWRYSYFDIYIPPPPLSQYKPSIYITFLFFVCVFDLI